MQTLFERIGGLSATRKLADEFYDVMQADEIAQGLLEMHPKKLMMSRLKLYKFLTQWLGGPELFGKQYVNVEWLELKHRRLNFTEEEKNQWLHCMNVAMDRLQFKPEHKQELISLFKHAIKEMQLIGKHKTFG